MKKESNKKSTKTDKSKSKVEKKNETKDIPVSNKDKVKDSSKPSTKKPDGQDNVVEKSKSKSEAGKGDKLRRGITQDEWEKRYEKIFGKKEKSV